MDRPSSLLPSGSEGIPEAERVMKVADGPEAFADEVVKMYQDPAE